MTNVELTVSGGGAKEVSGPRLIATLAAAGLLSGLALAGAYQVTKPRIDANKARALRAAVFEVVPGAARMQRLALRPGASEATIEAAGEADAAMGELALYGAYASDGRFLGYAIEGAGAGFQDTIRVLFGYDPGRRRVIGFYVLESRETPGLGDKIYKDAAFVANFAALAVEPEIVLVKSGREADNEVDAITGATISSRAVVDILNAATARWEAVLPPPGAEPPLDALAAPGAGDER